MSRISLFCFSVKKKGGLNKRLKKRLQDNKAFRKKHPAVRFHTFTADRSLIHILRQERRGSAIFDKVHKVFIFHICIILEVPFLRFKNRRACTDCILKHTGVLK